MPSDTRNLLFRKKEPEKEVARFALLKEEIHEFIGKQEDIDTRGKKTETDMAARYITTKDDCQFEQYLKRVKYQVISIINNFTVFEKSQEAAVQARTAQNNLEPTSKRGLYV